MIHECDITQGPQLPLIRPLFLMNLEYWPDIWDEALTFCENVEVGPMKKNWINIDADAPLANIFGQHSFWQAEKVYTGLSNRHFPICISCSWAEVIYIPTFNVPVGKQHTIGEKCVIWPLPFAGSIITTE